MIFNQYSWLYIWASLVAQMVKNLSAMQETQVPSLGWKDPLEKEMATRSSILAWRIPWTEESGGLQSMGLQRVGYDWYFHFYLVIYKEIDNRHLIKPSNNSQSFLTSWDRWHSPFLKSLYASPHVPFCLWLLDISVLSGFSLPFPSVLSLFSYFSLYILFSRSMWCLENTKKK